MLKFLNNFLGVDVIDPKSGEFLFKFNGPKHDKPISLTFLSLK